MVLAFGGGLHAANCPPITYGPVPFLTTNVPQIAFSYPNTVATGHFNHDKNLDIAYAATAGTYVMLGDGKGTFGSPTLATGASGLSLAVADLNQDGNPDLILGGANAAVRVVLGNTNGTFQNFVSYPASTLGVGESLALAVADFDGDGKLDIASTLFGSSEGITILTGRGDGTFNAPRSLAIPTAGGGLLAADFNGDGFVDLATTLSNGTVIAVLLNRGNGTFFAPTNTPLGNTASGLNSLRTADFNRDGIPDIAAISSGTNGQGQVSIFLGKGDGTFTRGAQKPVTATAIYNLAVTDVDGDGLPDLALASYTSVSILQNLGNGSFADALTFPATSVASVVSGDFNLDGKSDLVAFGADGRARILLNETFFLPPVPSLAWLAAVRPVRLVWYTNYPGFNLEFSQQLGSAASWKPVTNAPSVVDCQNFFTVPNNATGFYRLHKP